MAIPINRQYPGGERIPIQQALHRVAPLDRVWAMNAPPCRYRWAMCTAVALLTLLGACRLPGPSGSASTRTDRLMNAYSELHSGTFVVIADFEDAKHMELIHSSPAAPKASCVWNARGGRPETGGGCLRLRAGSRDDIIIFNNDDATHWFLKRDWRHFDLLLMAVHSPKSGLNLEVEISSGPSDDPQHTRSTMKLDRGWNVARLDLAEAGENILLDDVRELRLAISGMNRPVDVRFDDIILTAAREELFGDSKNLDGDLYVQRVGRRWRIGAGGRFEWAFAHGQVAEWYDLATDPYRLRNLVRGTTLGPTPVVLDGENAALNGFESLGERVVSRQAILEMSLVRAVVLVEWRFSDDPDAPQQDQPFQRWLYTIYPTGQIYVGVEATGATKRWSPPGLGLAVALSPATGETFEADLSPGADVIGEQDPPELPAYGVLRSTEGDAQLVFVPSPTDSGTRVVKQEDVEHNRALLIATDRGVAEAVKTWSAHLLLAGAGEELQRPIAEQAMSYARPPALMVEVGSSHGFEPSTGCYVLSPQDGRLRFVIEGTASPLYSPVFRIVEQVEQEGLQAWVYVQDRILDRVARDRAGNLLFQLPGVIRDRTTIEVLFRRPEPSPEG